MVIKAEKERLTALIKDTITLLCKNGLTFKSKFNIEALIGVTLDDGDVFLVSMNEHVKSNAEIHYDEEREISELSESAETSCTDETSTSPRSKRKKKKHIFYSGSVKQESHSYTYDGNCDNFDRAVNPDTRTANKNDGQRQPKTENLINDDDEIVVIKTESGTEQEPWEDSLQDQTAGFFPSAGTSGAVASSTSSQVGINRDSQSFSGGTPDQSWMDGDLMSPQNSSGDGRYLMGRPCDICGKSFVNMHSFRRHRQLHRGIYQYYCRTCGKGFSSSTTYRGHMAQHTGIKEFKCQLCGKEYSHKRSLVDHLRIAHNQHINN